MSTSDLQIRLQAFLQDDGRALKLLSAAYRGTNIGHMASPLMHDLNQPLVAIRLNAESLTHRLQQDGAGELAQKIASNILKASESAVETVACLRQFLSFKEGTFKELDFSHLLVEICALTNIECKAAQIDLHCDITSNLMVVGDVDQLRVAISAVLSNAVEALRHHDGPRDLLVQLDFDDRMIRLSIRDSGPGLLDSDIEHLYELLYSTKPGHFGLGLWLCKTILENHQATLTASNQEGSGACFLLMFPRFGY